MHINEKGDTKQYRLFSNGTDYRYELQEEGTEVIVIVQPGKEQTAMLLPGKKTGRVVKNSSMTSLSNDPVQSLRHMKQRYGATEVGAEQINGFACTKGQIRSGDQLLSTYWFSAELGFPVKIVQMNQYTMELKDVKKGEQPGSLFEIPAGFDVTDKRAPQAADTSLPSAWRTIEKQPPFHEVFERGMRVVVSVPRAAYYEVILTHTGSESAAVLRSIMREGKELPESEQGPGSYRTTRLSNGKNKLLTLDLKVSETLVLKVLQGAVDIAVRAEQ
jgi:hypothetical protein